MTGSRAPRQNPSSHEVETDYRYHRTEDERGLSMLAIVTRGQEQLAADFVATLAQGSLLGDRTERDVEVLLVAWETQRYGRPLAQAAHGILRGAVKRATEKGATR